MTKLTKDQKRAKAKRDEQKRERTRQHSKNAKNKVVAKIISVINDSMDGRASAADVENVFLSAARGTRPADRPGLFASNGWSDHKSRISSLVGMLRNEVLLFGEPMPMQGRVYLINKERRSFTTFSFPLVMREAAKWKPEEVLQNLAAELKIEPAEGIYCYGEVLGRTALHFAMVTVGGEDGFTEQYMVTPDEWVYLDPVNSKLYLTDLLDSIRTKSVERIGLRPPEKLMQAYLCVTPEDDKVEVELGEAHRRQSLITMLNDYLEEADLILEASHEYSLAHSFNTYDNGWEDGYAEGARELREMEKTMLALRAELKASNLKSAAALTPSQVTPLRSEKPLHQRMAHLLAPAQVR